MAFRYRQLYPQTGDVLDPRDWNLNHKELAEEFNGYLDRDNIPEESISTSMVETNALIKVHNYVVDDDVGTRVAIDNQNLGWQSTDGTNQIGSVEFFAPVDCLLICEFSATYHIQSTSSEEFIRFQIAVNGDVVAINGPQSLANIGMSLYLCGAIPVLAGTQLVQVKAQVGQQFGDIQGYARPSGVAGTIDVGARELVALERRR